MPSVDMSRSHADVNSYIQDRTSIVCIANHAYRRKLAESKEQRYATSFQRSKQYVEDLRQEVKDAVFKDSINNHTTPSYVFREITDTTYSAKHPLISKGLLSSNKAEQYGRVATSPPVWPSNRPRPQTAGSRSFYRPNSTHSYLSKTITLQGSHDGFNPNLGTPTRAQLLRNRTRFSSAPDLTYSYLADRRSDGKNEAVCKKNKQVEEYLQLKASKIEMDRVSNRYRKYMLGTQYTPQWIESHTRVVHHLAAEKRRPASSVAQRNAYRLPSAAQRRVVSAGVRHSPRDSEHMNTPRRDDNAESMRQNDPYKRPMSGIAHQKDRVHGRSANLIPYTTDLNSPRKNDHLPPSLIIRQAPSDNQSSHQVRNMSRRLESAQQIRQKIEKNTSSRSVCHPSVASSNVERQEGDETVLKPADDPVFFVTTPQDPAIASGFAPEIIQPAEKLYPTPTVQNETEDDSHPYPSSPIITESQALRSQSVPFETGTDQTDIEEEVGANQSPSKPSSKVAVELPEPDVASATLSQSVSIDLVDRRSPEVDYQPESTERKVEITVESPDHEASQGPPINDEPLPEGAADKELEIVS